MRSLKAVFLFIGVLFALIAGAPLCARPDDTPEVAKLKAEKELAVAQKEKLVAETELWKAKYGFDFGALGKSGAIEAEKYSSLPWTQLANGMSIFAGELIDKLGIKANDEVLIAARPSHDLVVKWRFFDAMLPNLMEELGKPIKAEPADFLVPEGAKTVADIKPLNAGAISVGVESLAAIIKLFQADKSLQSTEFSTGMDEALTIAVAGAATGKNAKVFVESLALPAPKKVEEIKPLYEKRVLPILKKLNDLTADLALQVAAKNAITKGKEDAGSGDKKGQKKMTKLTKPPDDLIPEAVIDEKIRQLTERIKLATDFITLYSLTTNKGLEDLVVGERLGKMRTISFKVVKSYGDTLKIKHTFSSDSIYSSFSLTVWYTEFGKDGDLIKSGILSANKAGQWVPAVIP